MEDLFADTTFGKLALQKLAPTMPNFRLYSAGWMGDGNQRDVMYVTGAEFCEAKRAPRKGELCIVVPGTKRTAYITAAEMAAFDTAATTAKVAAGQKDSAG